jgi:hypothetical protein
MVIVSGDCTSEGLTAVTQAFALAHIVLRATPLKRITEDEFPVPAAKLTP